MPKLSDTLQVKDYTLRNRIVFPPMQSGRADFNGAITSKLINFYVRRSAHIGLPIVEHAYIDLLGKIGPKQLGIYDDSLISGYEKLATALHKEGVPAIVQISHAGGVANKKVIHNQPVGPSTAGKMRMLEVDELKNVVEQFVAAAERAVRAGFDGVELHGAHGYLLNQFFSPLLNKRGDEYGGCLEGRMRFPLEVVLAVRRRLGVDKLLFYRVGSDDLAPYGTHVEDAVVFSQRLVAAGVDVLDVSGGMCGSNPKQFKSVSGYFVSQAAAVKREVGVPVVGVGGIVDPVFADSLVVEGKVDLVAVGRALWRDVLWARDAFSCLGYC
ncbi:MAG: NADH:flavin oxidoreductase [Nitrososphaerota archaeon]|nr:NADH:flavin oxidoreductase [Nitrososphaerota archaeon]